MSQEDVEVLDAFYAAFNRRDLDGLLRCVDTNLDLRPGVIAPGTDTRYLGHEGLREFMSVMDVWDTMTFAPTERVEIKDGRILSFDHWLVKASLGIEIERELPTLYAFDHGIIVRIDGFTDRTEALEAVGLSE